MFLANLPLYKRLSNKRSTTFANYIAAQIPDTGHMLDFGCGNMFTSVELLKLKPNLTITGIDVIRDQNLTDTILSDKRLAFKQVTEKRLPFDDNTFDVALVLAMLHHTDDPEYYLSELKRIIKPGGIILIIEEMYIHQLDRLYICTEDWLLNKMKTGVPVPLNFRSNKHYKEQFAKQGLKVLAEDGIRAFPTFMHHFVYKLTK
jgi:ubiquinone/menaquinone biosynthesis C-methylase UbiE